MSGIDLIKRTNPMLELGEPMGITTPLFSIAGKKMGKSENNAIWLSSLRTAPFDFFYYFYTVSDDEARELLTLFTAIDEEELGDDFERTFKRLFKAYFTTHTCLQVV